MTYDEIISALMTLGAIPLNSEDSNFTKIIPSMFHYADGRIYRDLAFLATDVNTLVPVIPYVREVALPLDVLTVRSVAICTPAGAITTNTRRHHPERISPEALDMFWPQGSFKVGLPKKYAIVSVRTQLDPLPNPMPPTTQPLPPIYQPERFTYYLRMMPSPDRAYMAEIFGGVEPQILSNTNPETFLSVYYPELLIACCMVYLTGYQRDYGAASDDPQRAVSWESQYKTLRDSVAQEAGRLRGEGPGFTALPPSGAAQQPRAP
jgi:hypothetical protein